MWSVLSLIVAPLSFATSDEGAFGIYSGKAKGLKLQFEYTNRGIRNVRVNGMPATDVSLESESRTATGDYSFQFKIKQRTAMVWLKVLFDEKEQVSAATAIFSWIDKDGEAAEAKGMVMSFKKCKSKCYE